MFDSDEKEVTFEEIGIPSKSTKQTKKIVKINLKIKQLPKKKDAFKGYGNKSRSQVENIANNSAKPSPSKPSTSKDSSITSKEPIKEIEGVEQPSENIRVELPISNLCNGTTCPFTDQIMNAIEELRELVKKNCNETRDIRQEFLSFQNIEPDDDISFIPLMRGPCQTLDDFYLLDNRVQEDKASKKALENLLGKMVDQSLDKYVRFCLRALLNDNVAAQCTWHGKNGNISVHDMAIMGVLCDCTRKKYPTASTSVIIKMIKKWFHHAKDRVRRKVVRKRKAEC